LDANIRFHQASHPAYILYQLECVIRRFSLSKLGATRINCERITKKRTIPMRRLLSLTAFGFGMYYLWMNSDPTVEMLAIGAMGVGVLLEFAGAD
jgi:hypothetical protein